MYRYMQVSYDKHVFLMTTITPIPQTGAANHPSEGSRQAAAQRGKVRRHLGPRATAPYRLISPGRTGAGGNRLREGAALLAGGSSEKSRTFRQPRLPKKAPQRPAPSCPPAAPHSAWPAPPTCVAAARPPPLRGPAALPRLRAREQVRVCSARAAHPASGLPPARPHTSAARKEAHCTPAGSYLESGGSPPTGSCARAPHGDGTGRQRRQVSDGQDYPVLPSFLPSFFPPSIPPVPSPRRARREAHPAATRRTVAPRGEAGPPCGLMGGRDFPQSCGPQRRPLPAP